MIAILLAVGYLMIAKEKWTSTAIITQPDAALAATVNDRFELTNEASDLMYHLLVLLQDQDLNLTTVIDNLRKRHQ
ncbi:hypothetical protein KU391_22950 [Salmonella enterica subsp. enterica serovar Mbandaka]|nr:hypothetical protein [Salmonella enterica subsp. enterica serovar Mbandaka]